MILDDIGYVQHNRDEMEVLFTFLAERYERKSVMLTTNLVFSEWERIFKDPMTTMAAIDRLVHHSVILDMMSVESYRAESASQHHQVPARLKKSSSGRAILPETIPSLQSVDASGSSSQESQRVSNALSVTEDMGKDLQIGGTQSAGLIDADGTV